MFAALADMEEALRYGDTELALHCVFVWSQRGERIMAGEETWFQQMIPDPNPGGQGVRTWERHIVEGEVVDSEHHGTPPGQDS